MKQPMFAKNTPIDEKRVSKIEAFVARLLRRSKKTAEAMLTPYPISNCISGENVSGTVLKYMFAARGIIGKGRIQTDKRLKSGMRITVLLENELGGQSKSYIANRNIMLVEPNLEVFSGDRLNVSVNPVDPEDGALTEIWIAFVWTPHIGEATVKSFLIDKVLEEIEAPKEIEDA